MVRELSIIISKDCIYTSEILKNQPFVFLGILGSSGIFTWIFPMDSTAYFVR